MSESSPASPPAVSVVMPIYNARDWLTETLESLQAQDCSDWECLCIDDGSTDGSKELLAELATRDARIRLITQRNGGAAAARNRGIKEARGEFLLFVDADDLLPPTMMSSCVARMREDESDLCAFEVDSFDSSTKEPQSFYVRVPVPQDKHHICFRPIERAGELTLIIPAPPWNKMYRTQWLHERKLLFPHTLKRSEDTPFGGWCLAEARRISCLRQVCYHYRLNRPGSQMQTLKGWSVCHCHVKAASEIWRGLRKRGLLKDFGVDGILLGLANARYYFPFLHNNYHLLWGAFRLRRLVKKCLKELEKLGCPPQPELRDKIRFMLNTFTRDCRDKYWQSRRK